MTPLAVLLLYQTLVHLEDQEEVVFRKPARFGSCVSLFINFIVCLVRYRVLIYGSHSEIICSGKIHGRVLFHSGSQILSQVFLMKRDFLFHNVAYLSWRLERGSGASGQSFLHGG